MICLYNLYFLPIYFLFFLFIMKKINKIIRNIIFIIRNYFNNLEKKKLNILFYLIKIRIY